MIINLKRIRSCIRISIEKCRKVAHLGICDSTAYSVMGCNLKWECINIHANLSTMGVANISRMGLRLQLIQLGCGDPDFK